MSLESDGMRRVVHAGEIARRSSPVRRLTNELPPGSAEKEGDEVHNECEYPKDSRVVVSGSASKRLRSIADRNRCARTEEPENNPAPNDDAEGDAEQEAGQPEDYE